MENVVYYGNSEGFAGVATREEVDALNKALSAGYGYSGTPTSFAGGTPLMVESLEASLKSTTWQMKNLVLWPSMPVDKAYNTIEQYSRITSYGGNGRPYFNEGGSPREEDSQYNRETQRVVYFGTRRRVTHAMMLVRVAFGDAVAREINNGNMWLLQNIERELYLGNGLFSNAGAFDGNPSAIHGDTLAINGLDQQIRQGDTDAKVQAVAFDGFGGADSVVRDIGGSVLSEDEMEEGAVSILNNFGVPTELHCDPKTLSDFSRQFFPKERIPVMGVADGRAGFVLREFVSSAGSFALKPNVFLRPKDAPKTTADNVDTPAAPAAPTTANGAADVGTTFALSETYTYRVAAVNEQGESLPSASSAVETIATAGEVITVTITNVANAKYYAVYRTVSAGAAGSEEFIGYVAQAAGATTAFTDSNNKLPGSAESFLLYLDPEAIAFKQLAPLSKINLATIAASFEWLQVLYGTLIVFTPRKHFIYENIGRS
jgi:hypothetical protein